MKIILYQILALAIAICQTPQQIQQAKDYIRKTGMSKDQARKAAIDRGFSEKQINDVLENNKKATPLNSINGSPNEDLNAEFNKNNEIQDNPITKTITEEPDIFDNTGNEGSFLPIVNEMNEVNEIIPNTNNISDPIPYFGYNIFQGDPELFQATSVGTVDPDYLIGPGDEIIITLWGETQFRQVFEVNREGYVFIPEIGQVFVNGLNLNLLESKLFRVLSQAYASLNPSGRKATTFMDISLGNLRPLRVQVLGEVPQPGAYTVSPSATLFSSLYYFNGPTTLGSLRDIKLIRGDKEIGGIDFYDYLLTGRKPKDHRLQLDDVIFIPKRKKTVTISGEVGRPGIYELKPNESLKDLIAICGELNVTAYLDRIQVDRIVPFDRRADLGMDRMLSDVDLKSIIDNNIIFELQDGDIINIFSVFDQLQNVVSINGSVTRPGTYDLGDSLSLSELIIKAGGLLGDAFMERVDIVRIKPDLSEELIKFNLSEVLSGQFDDVSLKSQDQVTVYSTGTMVPPYYVSINGHVKRPGRFILQDNMTLYDLIFKGRGFFDEEFKKRTYLDRAELIRIKKDSDEKEIIPFNLEMVLDKKGLASSLLLPGDAVRVYSKFEIEGEPKYIYLEGYVKAPGRYELYETNMTIYDLLFKGGGFDDLAFKGGAFLDRADIIRFENDYINKTIIPFNLKEILEDKSSEVNLPLKNGDVIRVYPKSVFKSQRSVSIGGAINNPGNYEYKLNMGVKDLILEAGGVNDDVFNYRVEIARLDPKNLDEDFFAETIIIEMENNYTVVSGETKNNEKAILLQPYDHVSVRPNPYFNRQKKVSVVGSVYYPGEYVIRSPDERINSILERAGGLRPNAYAIGSVFQRNNQTIRLDISQVLKKRKSKHNIIVEDGDVIIIANHPNIIEVRGEVNSPGFYNFDKGIRIKKVIDQAGGFSANAERKNVYVQYPNGKSKRYKKWLSNPKVLDGSIIVVGREKEEEPFDRTKFATEITSIIANIAQALAVIVLASPN